MSAVARAEKAITANLRAEELTLEGYGLDSLSPLLPFFAQLTRLKKLRLAKNNLSSLPEDLTCLRGVEYLDMSANPISGLPSVLRGLFCLTALKHLYIDLPFETDEDEIIVSLHSLESFNGTPLTENFDEDGAQQHGGGQSQSAPPVSPPRQSQQAWQPASNKSGGGGGGNSNNNNSNSHASTPLGAKTKWDDADMSQVQRLYQAANSVSGRVVNKAEFDEYTRNVVTHLHTLLTGEDDPFKRESEILKAKKIMFEYCFEEVARGAHKFDPNLSQVLSVLQETYSMLLDHYDRLSRNNSEDKERKLDAMKGDMGQAIQEIEQLMSQIDGKGAGGGGAGGGMDGASRAQVQQERAKMVEEIGWLKSENDKLRAQCRQSEMGRPTAGGGGTPSRSLGGASSYNSPNNRSHSQSQAAPAIGSKVLTLRQLKEAIDEIYVSKSKYDEKCATAQLPRETMEQHMYTYLNQKYGLKHLILEWATAIIQGIKKYSAEDNGVAVFGKILRNEVDEEFRFVQRQLAETVAELLRVYLKGKHPLKSDEDINTMMKKKINGNVTEDEYSDIVKYMYNADDSVTVLMRIKDILKQRTAPRRRQIARSRREAARDALDVPEPQLSYKEFLRILLDFQLEGHERFLSRFVRIFKQHDTDRNGIVNENEFRQVLRSVDASKTDKEVASLLDLIDPYNNQLITFSECVTFLSSELVRMMKEEGANA